MYEKLNNFDKQMEYSFILDSWRMLKDHQLEKGSEDILTQRPSRPISEILELVLSSQNVPSAPS